MLLCMRQVPYPTAVSSHKFHAPAIKAWQFEGLAHLMPRMSTSSPKSQSETGNRALRHPADPCKTFGMKVRVFCLAKRRAIQETLQHLRLLLVLGPEVLTKQLSRLLGAYCTSLISVAPVTNGIDTCTMLLYHMRTPNKRPTNLLLQEE